MTNDSIQIFGDLIDEDAIPIREITPGADQGEALIILDQSLVRDVRSKHNRDVNDYRNLGVKFIAEKERLTNLYGPGGWLEAINQQNALYRSSESAQGFDESVKTIENWMALQYMWQDHFEAFEANRHRGATYLWECYRHLKKGKPLGEFQWPKKAAAGHVRTIENALDTLDDIGLSELAPAIVESVVGMVHDMYNQGMVELEGEEVPAYSTTAEATVAQGILDKLNRRIDHIKNNSNWQEPVSVVTTLNELFNAFEVVADKVMNTHIAPNHKIRLSIAVHKDGQKS